MWLSLSKAILHTFVLCIMIVIVHFHPHPSAPTNAVSVSWEEADPYGYHLRSSPSVGHSKRSKSRRRAAQATLPISSLLWRHISGHHMFLTTFLCKYSSLHNSSYYWTPATLSFKLKVLMVFCYCKSLSASVSLVCS